MSSPSTKLHGLYTYPNNLSEVPEGSLLVADNVVLDADGEIQSRRGLDVLAETIGTTNSRVNKLLTYQSQLLAQYDSGSLGYLVPGVGWTTYSGSYPPVDANSAKTRSVEANSNLYFTSSNGVQKLDSYTGTPTAAGGIKALDIQASLAGAGSGFFIINSILVTTGNTTLGSANVSTLASTTGLAIGLYVSGTGIPANTTIASISGSTITLTQNATATNTGTTLTFYAGSQVAYRVLFGIKDANKNLILGSPSQRFVLANTGSTTDNVSLTITVPAGVTTNHLFQVYRSPMTVSATVQPNDECQLVYEGNPTSGQISAKSITITDNTPDALRGATIYTAASQEGILQSNDPPPLAVDIAQFKNYVFYANTTSKFSMNLALLAAGGTSGVAVADTITIGPLVTVSATTTNGSATLSSIASTTNIQIGQVIVGTGIPVGTKVTAVSTNSLTMSANATASGTLVSVTFYLVLTGANSENISTNSFAVATSGTPSQNITDTANSIVRVINRTSSNSSVYAYYLSGTTDLPGKMFLESRSLGGSAFSVVASAHGTAYQPTLPTSGTTVSATQSIQKNAIYCSKIQQPEAVPLTNVFYVGSAAYPIRRIIPLRDSLFILKDDGIYRLVGQTIQYFYVDLFDSTSKLLAPDSAVDLNNTIYCLSNQGVISVSDTGISVISRPIEGDLLSIFGANLTNVQNMSFGVSYQSDRKYIIGLISSSGDTNPTQLYVYNLFTNAWTRWTLSKNCGIVNPADNKLYFGDSLTNRVNKERKDFAYTDYVDDTFAVTITASSGTTVTLASLAGISVGDLLYQSYTIKGVITAIDSSTLRVTVQNTVNWSNASATIYKAITCTVQFQPQTGKAPQEIKQFSELELFFKKATFFSANCSFTSDLSLSTDVVPVTGNSSGAFGFFAFGSVPFGGTTAQLPLRTYVPLEKQRCSQLNLKFIHRVAYGDFVMNGFSLMSRNLSDRVSN